MRNNPKINERSKIISNSDNKRPLFLRVNDIQKRKNEEIAKRKNLLEKQQKEKEPEPSFIPNLSLTKKKEDKLRSIPQFLNDVDDWNKKKKDKSEKFHIALLTEEMKENTFHPQIDKHSLKIILQVLFLL